MTNKLIKPDHLGDGVYATDQGHQIMLTANHHDPQQASDVIYVDARIIESLSLYQKRATASHLEPDNG